MEHKSSPPPYTAYNNPTAPIYPTDQIPIQMQPQTQQPATATPPLHQNINVSVGGGHHHVAGHCPVCNGSFTSTYSCLGWLCCILCFPCGIICCCCCCKKKKCSKCGLIVG